MSDPNDSLFSEEHLQREVWQVLTGGKPGRVSIAYVGPALEQGRMDALVLADGLKGAARFVNRVAELYLGNQNEFQLEVEGEPRSGSLEVFLRFSHSLVSAVDFVGDSKFLTGLAIIATLTGFSAKDVGKSLISMFKKLRGRPITEETDLAGLLPDDTPIDKAELIRIYNDPDVQAAIRAAIRPLRKDGIERFETRLDRKPIETILKADVSAADAAEMDAIVSTEDKILDVEKASFVPHLAWHLSDHGKPFDAKIEDPILWDHVASGDRFGYGDRLHVTLHTEAERESNGRLRVTRIVSKVHLIERATGVQIALFEKDQPSIVANVPEESQSDPTP
jgi:hypothetical protein